MITAIDTSVLIDVISHKEQTIQRLASLAEEGRLVICEIVYAELCAGMSKPKLEEFLSDFHIEFVESGRETLAAAGSLWRQYIANEGRKGRVIADFLIGAHAQIHAQRLFSHDRGFYRKYFRHLMIVEQELTNP